MAHEEFDRIVASVPELSALGDSAPDGFIVLFSVAGERARVPRVVFIEHTNAIFAALKDSGADLAGVVGPVAGLDPLVRSVVLGSAFQYFKDWMLERCPLSQVPFSVFHLPAFIAMYRELTAGAPEYSGEFVTEKGPGR